MSEIDNIPDVSQYQGVINWGEIPAPIVLMKVSDGSSLFDKNANANYYGAKSAGKAVGMYHFAEGGDPNVEAQNFLKAVSPLAEGDVLILDWEVQNANPVSWCYQFMQIVQQATGVWPLLYINLNTLSSLNWNPILDHCGLWLADWNNNPAGSIPTAHVYVMQQYTDAGTVAGIAGKVDLDAWFGTVAQFLDYGYHAPALPPSALPAPVVVPPSPPAPAPTVTPPAPSSPPVVTPTQTPPETNMPVAGTTAAPLNNISQNSTSHKSLWERVALWFKKILAKIF